MTKIPNQEIIMVYEHLRIENAAKAFLAWLICTGFLGGCLAAFIYLTR